jgi:Ser/Thr protein kinase RdoA (MazF antagonist)
MRPRKLIIDPSEAVAWARDRYGIKATATEMPGEIDRNILLSENETPSWILKLSPTEVDRAEIECQMAALRHLEDTDMGHLLPRAVPDLDNGLIGRVRTAVGAEGFLRVVTYLPGYPLAKLQSPRNGLHREIGSALGRLDTALARFDHPGAHRRLVWDVARVLELRSLLELVEPDNRPRVANGLARFENHVVPRLSELPTGVTHNDANDWNLLVQDTSDGPRLSGIIDFGDMVHTIMVAEPAIACAYAMLDEDDPEAVAAEVIAGYESSRPLTSLERELLPHLVVARLCNSLLMSAQGRAMAPDDEYLRISERPVATLLRRLIP